MPWGTLDIAAQEEIIRPVLFVLGLLGSPSALGAPEAVDISSWSEKLVLVTDGQGHIAAFVPFTGTGRSVSMTQSQTGLSDQFVFYGDEKQLYRQNVMMASYDGLEEYDFWMRDPWMSNEDQPEIKVKDGGFEISCAEGVVSAQRVSTEERARILEKARFSESLMERNPLALFRDDFGVYYYVDRLAPEVLDEYRVFSGWQGDVKRTSLAAVARDSLGMVFSTRSGDRRLVIRGEQSLWYQKDESRALLELPIDMNRDLIYNQLGIYTDVQHGTPCDHLR